jgi:hypothetical protein
MVQYQTLSANSAICLTFSSRLGSLYLPDSSGGPFNPGQLSKKWPIGPMCPVVIAFFARVASSVGVARPCDGSAARCWSVYADGFTSSARDQVPTSKCLRADIYCDCNISMRSCTRRVQYLIVEASFRYQVEHLSTARTVLFRVLQARTFSSKPLRTSVSRLSRANWSGVLICPVQSGNRMLCALRTRPDSCFKKAWAFVVETAACSSLSLWVAVPVTAAPTDAVSSLFSWGGTGLDVRVSM